LEHKSCLSRQEVERDYKHVLNSLLFVLHTGQ
jgi:hypothetical protein